MALDESTLERMLAAGKNAREFQRPPSKLLDATEEFEVYERAAPEGVVEDVHEDPPEDSEMYPPRRHEEEPAQPPAAPAQAPPQAPPGPSPPPTPPPAPPPAGQGAAQPVQTPAAQAPQMHPPVPQPPAPTTPAPPAPAPARELPQAPSPVQGPAQHAHEAAQPRAPSRPQVFSLNRPTATPGTPQRTGGGDMPRIALVQADYNADVTDLMAQWALKHAQSQGAAIAHHVHVPGVYDIPLMAKILAKRDDVDAIVVVGAVVQGETGHDELITRETARLLADLAYTFEKPVGLGIAGPRMTMEQAEARIKMGRNAVESVLRQWATMRSVRV